MPATCAGAAYIKVETFRRPRGWREAGWIAETLGAPRFRPGWSALCVSVGTAVDDVTTGRFGQQAAEPARESSAEKVGPERVGEHAAPVRSTAGTVVERPERPGRFRAIRNRHGGTWGIKMKDHSTSRIASRVKDTLRLCREFISRSTGFHASDGRRAVQFDRPARLIRPVAPYARLSCSVSPIPVRTDRGGPPRFRD